MQHSMGRVRTCVTACGVLWAMVSAATAAAQTPAPVRPRGDAAYVLPDGTVQVVTCAAMAGVVGALNQLFTAANPGVTFSVQVGDNYSAMAALTFDRSAFVPLGTEYTRIGLGDNLKIAAEPVGFRIAHATLTPGPGVPALGVIVNRANPLTALSMSQLTRMFAVGAPAGDIATWGQAGVSGPLADREVHPMGPAHERLPGLRRPAGGRVLEHRQDGRTEHEPPLRRSAALHGRGAARE